MTAKYKNLDRSLFRYIKYKDLQTVTDLLEHGANPNQENELGHTPLSLAEALSQTSSASPVDSIIVKIFKNHISEQESYDQPPVEDQHDTHMPGEDSSLHDDEL